MTTPTALPERGIFRHAEVALAGALLAILCTLLVPLPAMLIDVALAINLSLSVLILVITLSCRAPLEFSTFPSLLLFTTLFRLSLNVASTRSILMKGSAGHVIQAFGDFVVGGNLVIGLVIFAILLVIQFVVISKGSNRISEVAARFTLDAMPGKQMAIDAELNAGLINETEARRRREIISSEAEFYGAMDGAGKFVRGDAVAGLIITIINILGGLGIGMADGMAAADALKKYAVLTVGDGLVAQIPALLISVASGILVTKQRGRHQLSREIVGQFLLSGRALRLAAGVTVLIGLLPGLPIIPFALMAVVFFVLGKAADAEKASPSSEGTATANGGPSSPSGPTGGGPDAKASDVSPEAITEMLKVDRVAVEVGYRLIPLACGASGTSQLVEHIGMLRKQFALQFGVVIPAIRMKDNLMLEPNGYRVLLAGQEIARGALYPDHWLAMGPGLGKDGLPGVRTTDPTFGLPAVWVPSSAKADAEAMGCTVVDPESVLVTHLTELLREHAHEILSRDDVQKLVDRTKEANPAVVNELVPDILPLGTVQAVLSALLRERIPIRNLVLILETLADHGRKQKDPDQLAEIVRQKLSRTLVELFGASGGAIHALTLDPTFEQGLSDAISGSNDPRATALLSPNVMRRLQDLAVLAWQQAQQKGKEPVLLVRASVRRYLADLFRAMQPRISVLSFNEVTSARTIDAAGTIPNPADAGRPAPKAAGAAA